MNDFAVPDQLKGKFGFRNFLYLAWKSIGLPDPTPIQYDIADFMQHGPDRQCTMAFRGIGKSYIASAFVVYSLLIDPTKNIMIVSASRDRADDFSNFCFKLLTSLGDLTHHLQPRDDQRCSRVKFDVGPAPVGHAPSVFSRGINSQLAGYRADIIISDDVSTPENSATQVMRDKIARATREFTSVLKPKGRTIYLGTPHSEQDLLHGLPDRGFTTRIWPSEVPPERLVKQQGERLAPIIREMIGKKPVGTPTDPLRFDEDELEIKKMEGKAYYAMQFLLDQSLSDMDRYPLRMAQLQVTDLNPELCYERYIWANDPDLRWNHSLPNVGFNGDHFYRPLMRDGELVKYQGIVMSVDPSGKGRDETGYSVVAQYGGQLFVLAASGLVGGYSPEVLHHLVGVAKRFKVNRILIESNFGQGMFTELLKPELIAGDYRCAIEEIRSTGAKEKRICDLLEPVMNNKRLIVDRSVIEDDFQNVQSYPTDKQQSYMLIHQMSRITRDRGALRHDDRLDALSMAVEYWVRAMAQDANVTKSRASAARHTRALKQFMAHATNKIIFGAPKRNSKNWMARK
tara:strand:- start:3132 stop:4841 length:1710 start_codon:yes stop_codon:yes gene_type:complete